MFLASAAPLCVLISAAEDAGSCLPGQELQDETSLMQIRSTAKAGTEREEQPLAQRALAELLGAPPGHAKPENTAENVPAKSVQMTSVDKDVAREKLKAEEAAA